MYIMLRIIVETTHLVISQYAHDATKGKSEKKKTIARRLSSGGRLREQIQHFFLLSPSIHLLQYADLAQPERRALCELVGTLNV